MTTPEIRLPQTAVRIALPAQTVRRAVGIAVLQVLGFWWLATGIMYVLQRNVWSRLLAVALAVWCLSRALRMLHETRDDLSPRGAVRAFLGGALVWAAIIGMFFEGWVVGPPPDMLGAATRGWAGAMAAVHATSTWELMGLLGLAGTAWAVRRAPNQLGLWTYVTFWVAHQTAKLNLFFGVQNPGIEIFPSYLSHLGRFVGPAVNSPLLPVTILTYVAMSGLFLVRARGLPLGTRMRYVVLAALTGLAALEHAFLATRVPLALWDGFLRLGRG